MKNKLMLIMAALAVIVGFAVPAASATPAPPPSHTTTTGDVTTLKTVTVVKHIKLNAADCAAVHKKLPKDDCTATVTTSVTPHRTLTGTGTGATPGFHTNAQVPDKCVPGVSYWATYKQQIAHWPAYSVTQTAQIGDDPCKGVAWVNDSTHHCVRDYAVSVIVVMAQCYSLAGNGWAEAYMSYELTYGTVFLTYHGAIVVSASGIYTMST